MVGSWRLHGVEWKDGESLVKLALGELLPDTVDTLLRRELLLFLLLLVVVGGGGRLGTRPTRVVGLF
jgi:hypothetical protein